MRVFYVNGDYLPEEEARIPVMDRGFLMADAIYEVVAVLDGKLLDFEGHWQRLGRSLDEISIANPFDRESFLATIREIARRNVLEEGSVYIQITRGIAERDFAIKDGLKPTVVMFTQARDLLENALAKRGLKVITRPDLRWARSDIKTTQLLYASLLKTEAVREGKDECWMIRDGTITEGTSNNAYIITNDNRIITRALSPEILAGITRASLLKFCEDEGLKIEERAFTLEEAQKAKEAFLTSAGTLVLPVVEIDGVEIGEGKAGAMVDKLRQLYIENARASAL